MQAIQEPRLEQDLGYRFQYLCAFIEFGKPEIETIHAAAGLLAPLVPQLVDAVYEKLRQYDATWRHFLPRQSGYDGEVPANLADLDENHAQIQFRKSHLARYLTSLVTRPYDHKMLQYLDTVGKIHTHLAGSPKLNVPLVQMNALLGYVADAFTATILGFNLPREQEIRTLRAFQKLLWLQNDLINRHYQASECLSA